MSKRPDAKCKACYSAARVVRHTTFAYWYCDSCKDEVSVVLTNTTRSPRGLTYGQNPDDIVLSTPGIYSITYVDGSHEWYEHAARPLARDTRLNRSLISASFRLADLDMPDRIKVQSVPTSSAGAKDEGFSLRTVSDAPNSVSRGTSELKVYRLVDEWPDDGDFIVTWYDGFNGGQQYERATGPRSSGRVFSSLTEAEVRKLAPSHFSVQHGSVPPDDTL